MYIMAALFLHPMVTWIPVYIVKCVDIITDFFFFLVIHIVTYRFSV